MSDSAAPPRSVAARPSLPELFRAFVVVSVSGFGGALPWARRMIVDIDDDRVQPLRAAGNPIKWSAFDDLDVRGPAPDLDEHRAALLGELGLGDD